MIKEFNILITGVGGQGVILMSELLGKTAVADGLRALPLGSGVSSISYQCVLKRHHFKFLTLVVYRLIVDASRALCYIARMKSSSSFLVKGLGEGKKGISSVPGGIRTHDPLLRRQPLCPTELQGQAVYH